MKKTQAEVIAQLEQDYQQAREKGVAHLQITNLCSYLLQRMTKTTGVFRTLTIRLLLRRIMTLSLAILEDEIDSNSLHVMITVR